MDMSKDNSRLWRLAWILSLVTIFYNIAEGLISTFFGMSDETIALFGFGVDSFVEVVSGIGIAHMIWRMRRNPVEGRDAFERRALKVTGTSFYILAAGLVIGAGLNLYFKTRPETTLPGIIISIVSILTMWLLYRQKMTTGTRLESEPIIADANCTKTCFYLSFILLASSILTELFHIGYIDVAGGLGIAVFAFREGREAFEKARSNNLTCSCHCNCQGS